MTTVHTPAPSHPMRHILFVTRPMREGLLGMATVERLNTDVANSSASRWIVGSCNGGVSRAFINAVRNMSRDRESKVQNFPSSQQGYLLTED